MIVIILFGERGDKTDDPRRRRARRSFSPLMSAMAHKRHFGDVRSKSADPRASDMTVKVATVKMGHNRT